MPDNAITEQLKNIFVKLLHVNPQELSSEDILLEVGADSLILVEVIKEVKNHFSVTLSIRQLFEDLVTIKAISKFIENKKALEITINQTTTTQNSQILSDRTFDKNNYELLSEIVASLLQMPSNEIDPRVPLLEIGADSLVLVELVKKIEGDFGIKLSIRQLFEDFLTIEDLSSFISAEINMNAEDKKANSVSIPTQVDHTGKVSNSLQYTASQDSYDSLDNKQSVYLQSFISGYISKTRQSKEMSQKYNKVLCNSRKSFAIIKDQIKDLFYTIHADKSRGSRFIDLDGNEYIDIAMGFGVHFFGHSPDFLIENLEDQLKLGLQLGPEHPKVGAAASYINELTGCDRVVFCNTGTEAIMTALRIVRAYTGRDKVAIFKNSYHGHFDSTLVVSDLKQPGFKALPMAKGTPQSLVEDIIVLGYDDPSAISYIQQYGHQLAAVLVEPVQNRRPDLHPKDFLLQLRKATHEHDIPLVFDEILTGFRIAQGGAQEYFDVQADMVAYGKVIGGGLPISVVAGKKELMSYVDGGVLGDEPTETTYTAGTFIKNPLSIVAVNSVLSEIKRQGKKVYDDLNKNTEHFINRMNTLFDNYNVPFLVENFGSFFRFSQSGNLSFVYRPIELDLFYYHMIYNGVYLWEGATCFLSTSHSNEDIDQIIEAADKSIKSLLEGGFFKNVDKKSDRGSINV